MSRLIRDTDVIKKLNNLIEAIETKPDNVFYGKEGLLKIANAIIEAINKTDEAYDVEAVVRELREVLTAHEKQYDKYHDYFSLGVIGGIKTAIEIVRGGRNE